MRALLLFLFVLDSFIPACSSAPTLMADAGTEGMVLSSGWGRQGDGYFFSFHVITVINWSHA